MTINRPFKCDHPCSRPHRVLPDAFLHDPDQKSSIILPLSTKLLIFSHVPPTPFTAEATSSYTGSFLPKRSSVFSNRRRPYSRYFDRSSRIFFAFFVLFLLFGDDRQESLNGVFHQRVPRCVEIF